MGLKKNNNGDAANAAPGFAADSAAGASSSAYAQLSFNDTLEDLSSRFIVNLPAEEQTSIERICFQVEQAHWFYEDFLRPLNPKLPSLALRRFSSYLLHAAALTVPLIQKYIATSSSNQQGLDVAFDEFLVYKTRVPVCGAVMLNDRLNRCVLVKGWKASAAWGFPKGKINQQESERDCAVREVFEETGYDCGPLVPADSTDYIECTMRNQRIRLYIVPGVDEYTSFETQTRKEISKIAWFNLSDLPTWKENKAPPQGMGGKFYLISPFVGMLKKWIQQNRTKYKSAASKRGVAVEDANTGDEEEILTTADRSGDLKALLGLGAAAAARPVVVESMNGKGPRMIEEQGDERGRQLLDLLRGAPASDEHRPGTPQQNFGADPVAASSSTAMDERERGTASLLAALNAGSGRSLPNGNGASPMDLLSLLNGAPPPDRSAQFSSPLPAPRAQRTSQAQSLLSLITPSSSMTLSEPAQSLPAAAPGSLIVDNKAEQERAQKRDALLSNLMSSSLNLKSQQQADQPPPGHPPFPYPPPPPALPSQYYGPPQPPPMHSPHVNGAPQYFAYPPPPQQQFAPQSPPAAYQMNQPNGYAVQQAPLPPPPSGGGGNSLLSLLNAGPPASNVQTMPSSLQPLPAYAYPPMTAAPPPAPWLHSPPVPYPGMYAGQHGSSPYPPLPSHAAAASSPHAYYAPPPPPSNNGYQADASAMNNAMGPLAKLLPSS